MIRHNIKIAVRNLLKYKFQTTVSILSLALGMVFFSLTTLWLRFERSYDTFHRDVDDTYLEVRKQYADNDYEAYMHYQTLESQAARYPQIKSWTRCGPEYIRSFKIDENTALTLRYRSIDDNYQDFFDVAVIAGGKQLQLHGNEIAVTQSLADRIFDGDALGKNIEDYVIRYVIENPRQPSVFRYDFLTAYEESEKSGSIYNSYNFLRVNPGNLGDLSTMLENDSVPRSYTYSDGYGVEHTVSYYDVNHYKLIPMKEVRKSGTLEKVLVNVRYVFFFMILSIIMIICALANYYTMLVTKMGIRGREISLRYANGAGKLQIISLFSTEILLLLLAALMLGAIVCEIGLPFFIRICGIEKTYGFFIFSYFDYAVLVGVTSFLIASLIVALTGRRQLSRSIGNSKGAASASGYRISIGFQVAISLFTVFCSLVMILQIRFLSISPEMGFQKKNMGYAYQHGMTESDVEAVMSELRKMPEIEDAVYGFRVPLNDYYSYSSMEMVPEGFSYPEDDESLNDEEWEELQEFREIEYVRIPANRTYLELLGVQLVAGKLFDADSLGHYQTRHVIINETMAREIGYTPAECVGKHIGTLQFLVVGVAKDLCYSEPTTEISPLCFYYDSDGEPDGLNPTSYFLFRYGNGIKWSSVEEKLNKIIDEVNPNNFYAAQDFEELYRDRISSEIALSRFLVVVTLICIIIATTGVFSIVSLACERRKKEIAIRKVNGAKPADIIGLFMKEYMTVLIMSSVVSLPIGYILMRRWLSVYVKQVPISAWMFIVIIAGMALLMSLTIISHIRRAAKQDPALVIKSD